MTSYGATPANDEIEISVFGPGYGEAIAVHVGGGYWFLVDSCINPESKKPASHTYLEKLGVQPNQVKLIVASHWHDDHVKGISDLASYYPDAAFVISASLNSDEAISFLCAHSESHAPNLSRGTNELHKVISQRDQVEFAMHKSSLLEIDVGTRKIRASALSPVPAAFAQSIANFAQYIPSSGTPINHAPELRPNHESVVIHIDFDGDAAILGSDLEDHHQFGWAAIVDNAWCMSKPVGSAYKVAHHGSKSGDHQGIWERLLDQDVVACLTPFNKGSVKLPSDEDKQRIKRKTPNAYISSSASRKPALDSAVLKRLGDICNNITPVNTGFGMIRLRKKIGSVGWNTETFGNAASL